MKVKAIADAKIKADKIDATVLAHLLRADLVPEAWAPNPRSRDLRVSLRERMFYVRLRTMTKNRIVTVFDRYPEQTAQLKQLGDTFGKAGCIQLAQVNAQRSTASRLIVLSPSSATSMCASSRRKRRSGQ